MEFYIIKGAIHVKVNICGFLSYASDTFVDFHLRPVTHSWSSIVQERTSGAILGGLKVLDKFFDAFIVIRESEHCTY